MNKYLMLLAILVLPGAIFLTLKYTGRNEYALQIIDPPIVEGCEKKVDDKGVYIVQDFEMIDQDGKPFNLSSLEGKIAVVSFFFTKCPDICPLMTSELLRVHEKFVDNPLVKQISFTVDSEHDSSEVLRQYADSYRINTQQWSFLTGDKQKIADLAKCSYLLAMRPDISVEVSTYHSDSVALVDKEGHIRGFYEATDREEIDRLITEIQILLYQYGDL